MPIEWGAIAILATAVLALFGYVLAVGSALHAFKLHVAEQYVREGAVDKLTKAVENLAEKMEGVSKQVAVILAKAEPR